MSNPPYFDGLLQRLAVDDPRTVAAFSRHVHWGYWRDPAKATGSPEDYGAAAENLCRTVCDAAEIRDGIRVLDVGCGFGGTLASLNERFSKLQLVGVNIDARQLERASRLVRPSNGNSVEFVEADAANIPLLDADYDAVLAVECAFHFDRPAFFTEAARVLRPGGSLTLSDFVPHERALEYLDAINFAADEGIRWSYGDIDLSYSLSRYQKLADDNQLTMDAATDVTENTLPTYDFLYASTSDWPDADQVELFTRATRALEKASRKGVMSYQILRFSKP